MKQGEHPEIRWPKTNKTTNGYQRIALQTSQRKNCSTFPNQCGVAITRKPLNPRPELSEQAPEPIRLPRLNQRRDHLIFFRAYPANTLDVFF